MLLTVIASAIGGAYAGAAWYLARERKAPRHPRREAVAVAALTALGLWTMVSMDSGRLSHPFRPQSEQGTGTAPDMSRPG